MHVHYAQLQLHVHTFSVNSVELSLESGPTLVDMVTTGFGPRGQ